MASIDRITDTTLRGLGIGVLAGVSGGVLRSMDKLYPVKRKHKRKRKKGKRRKRR